MVVYHHTSCVGKGNFGGNGAVATDGDWPKNTLRFSLNPDVPLGALIDPLTGQFSWTVGAEQIGTHQIRLTVKDDGIPNLSDGATFEIKVVERVVPQIVTVTAAADGTLTLQWTAPATGPGRIQFKTELDSPIWQYLEAPVASSGTNHLVSDSVIDRPHRFYRVVVE